MKAIFFLLTFVALAFGSKAPNAPVILGQQIRPHPRLLFTVIGEKAVKRLVEKDTLAKKLYVRLLQESDSLIV